MHCHCVSAAAANGDVRPKEKRKSLRISDSSDTPPSPLQPAYTPPAMCQVSQTWYTMVVWQFSLVYRVNQPLYSIRSSERHNR